MAYNPVCYALAEKLNLRRKSIWQSFHYIWGTKCTNKYETTFLLALIRQTLHLTKQLIIIQETLTIQYSYKYSN